MRTDTYEDCSITYDDVDMPSEATLRSYGDQPMASWRTRNAASARLIFRQHVLHRFGVDIGEGPLGSTADGHPVIIGETYWNNDLRPCTVTGVSGHDFPDGKQPVCWFKTDKGTSDGSRLGYKFEGKRP
jgi:hypothetical protein